MWHIIMYSSRPTPFLCIIMHVTSGRKEGFHQKAIALYLRLYSGRGMGQVLLGSWGYHHIDIWCLGGCCSLTNFLAQVCTEDSSSFVAELIHAWTVPEDLRKGKFKRKIKTVVESRPVALEVSGILTITKSLLSSQEIKTVFLIVDIIFFFHSLSVMSIHLSFPESTWCMTLQHIKWRRRCKHLFCVKPDVKEVCRNIKQCHSCHLILFGLENTVIKTSLC